MSIRLKVPSKPAAEFVSHGNFSATLKPGSTITVENQRFADWLCVEYACAEVGDADTSDEKETGGKK